MIRLCTPADAAHIHAIYSPIVRDTAISFEWEIPDIAGIRARIEQVLAAGYPWLVAEADGGIAGYAYASAFRPRAAYAWSVEASVYVDPAQHRRGLGRTLGSALLQLLELQGYHSAYAVTTAGNAGSEALLRRLGFEEVGRFPRAGYKLGAWHDVGCWYRPLGPQDRPAGEVRPVTAVVGAWS